MAAESAKKVVRQQERKAEAMTQEPGSEKRKAQKQELHSDSQLDQASSLSR